MAAALNAYSVFARPARRRDLWHAATIALVVAAWAGLAEQEQAEVKQIAERLRQIASAGPTPEEVGP